jgi:hypothetical protein
MIRVIPFAADPVRNALRGPGESYSDVIIRLAAVGHKSLNGSGRASLGSLSIPPLVSVLCSTGRG